MAITYSVGVDAARDQIASSTLPEDVKCAIDNILAEIPEGERVGIATGFKPGDNLPPGIDILFVDENSPSQISLPSGVPVVILETETGRYVDVDGSLPVILHAGAGDDVISVNNVTPGNVSKIWGGDGNDTINGSDQADYLFGGNGDDVIRGGAGDDTISGGAGNNLLDGDEGNDTFYLTDGADTVDGGEGVDLVLFADFIGDCEVGPVAGNSDDYRIEWEGSTAVVFNLVSGQQSEISDVEYLQWADSAIIVASNDNEGAVARLYEALFDRTGEYGGIKFWFDQYREGATVVDIAARMLDTHEGAELAALSNEEFVDLLYHNTLGRDADAAGQAFWLDLLNESGDRAHVAASFVLEQESEQKTADVIHITTDDDDQFA